MIQYCQETDSKIIFGTPNEIKISSGIPLYNFDSINPQEKECVSDYIPGYCRSNNSEIETLGRNLYQHYSIKPDETSIVSLAWNTINICKEIRIVTEAKNVLSAIDQMIFTFRQFKFDLGVLSPLRAFNLEDGTILLEWIYPDFRIGFSFEKNKSESGWYLVSNKNFGEISASGFLENIDVNKLVLWLLNFVISNS